ncbi:MAG: single-stranded DNA-binding protein [Lachnospiraceae bacterium]
MNRITLYGRLTRKPETLSGSNGKPVCRFSISVRRKYRREGEEYRYDFF